MSRIVIELPAWLVIAFLVVFGVQLALDGLTTYWQWRRDRERREWTGPPP